MLTALAFAVFGFFLYRSLGAPGIGLANTLAFSGEAILLLYLLNRRVPGLLQVGRTLLRSLFGGLVGSLVAFGGMAVLGESLVSAAIALLAGGAVVLPFIWPEIKLLIKL
jgi:peptidoglycan biosynthesis protein MviN/MurJ (putative lipid II flippase)